MAAPGPDPDPERDSRRVAAFSIALARAMRLPDNQTREIARGAYLRDIGKIALPPEILEKPGSLTPAEVTLLREHCYYGYQMLRKISFLAEASQIAYSHHERWDGTGYPRRLKATEIDLESRIVSLADALSSMTSDRPYRQAYPLQSAISEIEKQTRFQFDPDIVDLFLSMPDRIWDDLRTEADEYGL